MEEWKDIPWYEWRYQASTLGRIKSMPRKTGFVYRKEKILKVSPKNNGYYRVCLDYKTKHLHRIILLTFVWDSNLQVNHIDGNKANNKLDNLEYVTQSENMLHSIRILWNKTYFQTNHPRLKWKNHPCSRKVQQYSMEWELIKTRDSITEAALYIGCDYSSISACCRGKIKSCYNFKWKYYENKSL